MSGRMWLIALVTIMLGCSPGGDDDEFGDDDDSTEGESSGDDDSSVVAVDKDDDGWTVAAGDCNDTDADVHPGANEACDGRDNNCDGQIPYAELDHDRDGYRGCEGDCADTDPAIHPGVNEVLCDGLDNDCSDTTDDDPDSDGDGVSHCDGDCMDDDETVHPGAEEICDGLDNDCDGTVPEHEGDADLDGQLICEGDCDDLNSDTGLGFEEICDGLDNDCDGTVPDDELDGDGDGQAPCAGDCDDADPAFFLGAQDLSCDGIDHDCMGEIEVLVPTDFPTIQDAIDASTDYGEICVLPGTYFENLIVPAKGLTIISISGAEQTIIDGSNLDTVVAIEPATGDYASSLAGFTITNGYTSSHGGGIYVEDSDPVLQALVVIGNTAGWYGGGIYFIGSSPNISGVVIQENQASGGGGIYGGLCSSTDTTIADATILGNVADEGGGILMEGCKPRLSRIAVIGNALDGVVVSADMGGTNDFTDVSITDNEGIGLDVSWSDDLTLSNITVSDNSIGGVQFSFVPHGTMSVRWTNGLISGNGVTAHQNGEAASGGMEVGTCVTVVMENVAIVGNFGSPGGLQVWGGMASLTNGIIAGNTSEAGSGGVRVYGYGPGGGCWLWSTIDLHRVALVGNTSLEDYWFGDTGGIYLSSWADMDVANTIVAGNTSTGGVGGISSDGDATPDFDYCDVYGNSPNDVSGLTYPEGVDGNLSVDPMFLDTSAVDPLEWDLHLDTASSLIDAGYSTDPDGTPGDIGPFGGPHADEWDLDLDGYPSWWQPGPYDHATYPGQGWDCDDLDPTVYPGSGC